MGSVPTQSWTDQLYLQLAQDSAMSSSWQSSTSSLPRVPTADGVESRQGYGSVRSMRSTYSSGMGLPTSSSSAPDMGPPSYSSTSGDRPILEIIEDSQEYAMRSLPLQPPNVYSDGNVSESDSVGSSMPSLAPGISEGASVEDHTRQGELNSDTATLHLPRDVEVYPMEGTGVEPGWVELREDRLREASARSQPLLVVGHPQGISMSPSEYMARFTLISSFDDHDFRAYRREYCGEFYDDNLEFDEAGAAGNSAPGEYQDGQTRSSSDLLEPEDRTCKGSTEGMTATYLTTLSVRQVVHSVPSVQVKGLVLEIPFAEQDDPPEDEVSMAALLELSGEIEHEGDSST